MVSDQAKAPDSPVMHGPARRSCLPDHTYRHMLSIPPPLTRPLFKPHLHTLDIPPPELSIEMVPIRPRTEPYGQRVEMEVRDGVLDHGGSDAKALMGGEDH